MKIHIIDTLTVSNRDDTTTLKEDKGQVNHKKNIFV